SLVLSESPCRLSCLCRLVFSLLFEPPPPPETYTLSLHDALPISSWGNLIGLGRDVLRVQWYVSAIPGVAILITVLAVSLVGQGRSEEHTSELQSHLNLVCRLLLEKKKETKT